MEHISQTIPVAMNNSLLVKVEQLAKIVAKAQTNAHGSRRLVAFEHKSREKLRRTVLDRQRVREAEIVLGNDVWVDQSHRETPDEACLSEMMGLRANKIPVYRTATHHHQSASDINLY